MSEALQGRALDASVAEKVMGWKCPRHYQDERGNMKNCGVGGYLKYGAHTWARRQFYQRKEQQMVPCDHFDHYSTDITTAWQVVTQMSADGWKFELLQSCGMWYARFRKVNDPKRSGLCADADTAPMAICVAALRAVETAKEAK